MTTRLTSLDDVFLDKADATADGRRRLRPGLPRLRGRARRPRGRPRARCSARSVRRALGHPPAVAPEGGARSCCSASPPCRPSCSSASATSPATPSASDFEWITYREYVGVSNTLLVFVALTAPDIMCPDRRQRVLPLLFARPLTGVDYVLAKVGAMFAILFAFSFLPQVVLFVGPDARERRRRPRATRATTPRCSGRCPSRWRAVALLRGRSAWRSRRSRPAGSSPARRSSGCFLVTSHRERASSSRRARGASRAASAAVGPPSTIVTEDGERDRRPERRRGRVRRRLDASTASPSAGGAAQPAHAPAGGPRPRVPRRGRGRRTRCRASTTAACTRCSCTAAC